MDSMGQHRRTVYDELTMKKGRGRGKRKEKEARETREREERKEKSEKRMLFTLVRGIVAADSSICLLHDKHSSSSGRNTT
jgi:hypothetical protein